MESICETCKNLPVECENCERKPYCCCEDCCCTGCEEVRISSKKLHSKCETCKLLREINFVLEEQTKQIERKRKNALRSFCTIMSIGFLIAKYVI